MIRESPDPPLSYWGGWLLEFSTNLSVAMIYNSDSYTLLYSAEKVHKLSRGMEYLDLG
jgi:hypothetical protein